MNPGIYERYARLRDSKGLTDAQFSKIIGISKSTLSEWRSGRYVPKADKLQKIADYFGVSLDYLMTGDEPDAPYYMNDDARDLAQFLFENPDYKVMFDAVRKVKKEDLEFIKEMIDRASR